MTEAAGALLFARYAYPPNSLGLCGADSPRHAARVRRRGRVRRRARGARAHLRGRLALPGADRRCERDRRSARPARRRGLLGRQRAPRPRPPGHLARHVDDRFRGRLGRAARPHPSIVAAGAVPHHCFHVFAVYPVARPAAHRDRRRAAPHPRPVPDDAGARALGRRRVGDRARASRCSGRTGGCGSASRSRAGALARRRARFRHDRGRATSSRCTGTSSATSSRPGLEPGWPASRGVCSPR